MDSYSLKEVAAVLLKGKISKFDMPYAWISPYFGAGGGYLRRLAIYCEQDVNVTLTVMIKMFLIGHAIEIARATYTSISAQMLQGQQIRTWNLLVRYAHYNGWLLDEIARLDAQEAFGVQVDRLPRYLKKFIPKDDERFNDDNKKDAAKIKYAGATVLVPTTGFYTSLVCTADFASLYPSIMVSHVLCFSTWTEHRYDPKTGQIWFPIHGSSLAEQNFAAYKTWNVETEAKPTAEELAGRDLIMVVVDRVNDITTCFTINRGAMLPSILTDLLALRKRVRKEEAVAKENGDKFLADVLDARQAAIKVTCNAAYGFCGAIIGFFGFVAIASTTCTIGRFKIEQTKKVFEDELGGTVIYGDTDSVFVIFKHLESQPNKTIDEIREDVKALADRGCKLVSSRLPPPMKLEFEKAMTPFLMIIKKQYCGQWIFPEPKTFFKGTANVRRDSCDLARKTIGDTLKAVLATPNDKSAILKPLNDALAKMVDPDLDINLLVRTVGKNIIKKTEELQQIKLIQKIEKRRGAPLDIGTRVRMIITLPQGGTRVRTKDDGFLHDAEEVQYAIDNGIKPDRAYYCERQLLRPLVRYIGSIIPPAEIKALVDAALAKIYVLQSNVHTVTDYFGRMI
jgi:DNA polymerase delta subunit 1